MSGNSSLRARLSEVTKHPATEQVSLMAQVCLEIRHTVRPANVDVAPDSANCVSYATGLSCIRDYVELAYDAALAKIGHPHAGLEFLQFLLDRYLAKDRKWNGLVVYLYDARAKHIGLLMGPGLVRSKWGPGLVWDHAIWDVPTCYGNEVQAFKSIRPEVMLAAFRQFLKSQPGSDQLPWDLYTRNHRR